MTGKPAADRERSWSSRVDVLLPPLAILAAWQLASIVLPSVAVASVDETVRAISHGFSEGWLSEGLRATLYAVGVAFLMAATAGLVIGFVLGLSVFWTKVLEPPLVWLTALPKVTLFPIFLLFFGLGDVSKITYGAFVGVFPLVLTVLAGMKSVPPSYLKVARVYRLGTLRTVTRVVLPSIIPAVAIGIRYCFSFTFIAVVVSEMFSARSGAGRELISAIVAVRPERIYSIAVVLILAGFITNALLVAVQKALIGTRRFGSLDEGVAASM